MTAKEKYKAYISYSRRSDYSFIRQLLSEAADTEWRSLVVEPPSNPEVRRLSSDEPNNIDLDAWDLIYDENGLETFGSIEGFMDELSEGERVIVLLSKGYFESPYCMTELLSIYNKRAGELIPIVAFLGGLGPGDLSVSTVEDYWKQRQQALATEAPAAAAHAKKVHEGLKSALAWLLGCYDNEKEGWDTLFPVIDTSKSDSQNAVAQVFHALSKNDKPRYPYISGKAKRNQAQDAINRIVTRTNTAEWFRRLAARFSPAHDKESKLVTQLVAFEKAAEFRENVFKIIAWLDEDLVDLRANPEAAQARERLAGDVKDILGWLLLMIMDDTRLHALTHALNRQGVEARHEMLEENESSFQIIAAALAGVSVRYLFDPAGSRRLKGEGHIDLLEQGTNSENYRKWIADEEQWFNLKTGLFSELPGGQGHKTEKSLDASLDIAFELRRGSYLVVEKALWDTAKCYGFLRMLGDRFRYLHQVISSEDAETPSAQSYYRDGIESGAIDQLVSQIYQRIHELTQ